MGQHGTVRRLLGINVDVFDERFVSFPLIVCKRTSLHHAPRTLGVVTGAERGQKCRTVRRFTWKKCPKVWAPESGSVACRVERDGEVSALLG